MTEMFMGYFAQTLYNQKFMPGGKIFATCPLVLIDEFFFILQIFCHVYMTTYYKLLIWQPLPRNKNFIPSDSNIISVILGLVNFWQLSAIIYYIYSIIHFLRTCH